VVTNEDEVLRVLQATTKEMFSFKFISCKRNKKRSHTWSSIRMRCFAICRQQHVQALCFASIDMEQASLEVLCIGFGSNRITTMCAKWMSG